MHTLAQNYKAINLFSPLSITATTVATAVNVEKYEDDAMIVVNSGAQAGTTETTDVVIEVSTDGTNYTTGLTFAQFTGADGDNKIAAGTLRLHGIKTIRANVTKSSTGAGLLSVVALVKPRLGGASTNSLTLA